MQYHYNYHCHQYGDNVAKTIFKGTTEQIYLIARIIMKFCTVHCIYIYIKWACMYLQI